MSDRKAVDLTRRSRRWAFIWMFLALASGLGATALVARFLKLQTRDAAPMMTASVVVATQEIPLGSTITEEMVKAVDFPQSAAPKGAFANVADVVGRVPRVPLVADEPLLESRLAPKEAGAGFGALIPPEMRAMAVKVNEVIGVAGFVHPNDWVDVITVMSPGSTQEPRAKVILQRVRVFAVGQKLESAPDKKEKAQPVTVVTLLVTPEQSESLALAALNGKIQLSLRAQSDESEVETFGIDPRGLLASTLPAETKAEPGKRRVAKKPPAPPQDAVEVVEVFRGHKLEERKIRPAAGKQD